MVNAPKHCSNLKNSPFTILIINGKSIVLQKFSISDMQNLKTVSKHTECRWQVFSLDRDNSTQRIKMELSGKQKTFSEFFASFLKSSLTLEHFQKKDDPRS